MSEKEMRSRTISLLLWLVCIVVALYALFSLLAFGKAEAALIFCLPDPLRGFVGLGSIGALLVIFDFVLLVFVIPLVARLMNDSEAKTEFYSVRAAYCMIMVGLALILLLGFATALARVLHR